MAGLFHDAAMEFSSLSFALRRNAEKLPPRATLLPNLLVSFHPLPKMHRITTDWLFAFGREQSKGGEQECLTTIKRPRVSPDAAFSKE